MKFDWHSDKAKVNLVKHGVSFEEARTVFADPFLIDFYDPDHSDSEERFIIVGQSRQRRLLVVSYTERQNKTRLISARLATKLEKEAYEEG